MRAGVPKEVLKYGTLCARLFMTPPQGNEQVRSQVRAELNPGSRDGRPLVSLTSAFISQGTCSWAFTLIAAATEKASVLLIVASSVFWIPAVF